MKKRFWPKSFSDPSSPVRGNSDPSSPVRGDKNVTVIKIRVVIDADGIKNALQDEVSNICLFPHFFSPT